MGPVEKLEVSVIVLSGGWGDNEELASERFLEGGRI